MKARRKTPARKSKEARSSAKPLRPQNTRILPARDDLFEALRAELGL